MFCTNCGIELKDQDKFCNQCGTSTRQGAPAGQRTERLSRPVHDKKIAGVCAGFRALLRRRRDASARPVAGRDGLAAAAVWRNLLHRGLDRDAERSGACARRSTAAGCSKCASSACGPIIPGKSPQANKPRKLGSGTMASLTRTSSSPTSYCVVALNWTVALLSGRDKSHLLHRSIASNSFALRPEIRRPRMSRAAWKNPRGN